jgi:tetratricopeptide (TPR) repeat protein
MDAREAHRRTTEQLDAGNAQGALVPLWALLSRSHMTDEELRTGLALADRAYTALGRRRAVTTLRMFRGDLAGAQSLAKDAPLDRARLHVMAKAPAQAARAFEEAGWLGHAAIQQENAGDLRTARLLWERLTQDPRLRQNLYILGLVRFNLSRACQQLEDHAAARRERVLSMQAIEAAADGFETIGQRERAFDCYQVLLNIGKEGAFENLAEGYLGCIRILTADHLKYYVLQYFEDFAKLAVERGELHTAATLLREAAQFCRRNRLPYEAHYRFSGRADARAGGHQAARRRRHARDGGERFLRGHRRLQRARPLLERARGVPAPGRAAAAREAARPLRAPGRAAERDARRAAERGGLPRLPAHGHGLPRDLAPGRHRVGAGRRRGGDHGPGARGPEDA